MTEVLFIAQGLLGALLFVAGDKRPHDGLHILYGVLLVIARILSATMDNPTTA